MCLILCSFPFAYSSQFIVDVWSAACILAEMITGKVVFPGHDSILKFTSIYINVCVCVCVYLDYYIFK